MQTLLIFGASVRAAAQSAVRAGFRPVCGDLFADEDLRAVAEVLPLDRYPHDLPRVSRSAPPGPWMYSGALENHPQIIAAVSADRPLWGNPADVLAAVRDPLRVEALLRENGLPVPDVRPASDPPAADGSWMRKPLRSAAGRGVCVWDNTAMERHPARRMDCQSVRDASPRRTDFQSVPQGSRSDGLAIRPTAGTERHYFQRRIVGEPISALFIAAAGATRLIGIARQLVGESWLHAAPFQFCGSIAPIAVDAAVERQVGHTGDLLAGRFGLRGLFGCDFQFDGRTAWLTEINPRYTASVELFEHAYDVPLLAWHARACETFAAGTLTSPSSPSDEGLRRRERGERERGGVVGKAIVYAPHDLTFPPSPRSADRGLNAAGGNSCAMVPLLADIPAAGSVIAAGHPVCTLFAVGPSEADCRASLRSRAADLLRDLRSS